MPRDIPLNPHFSNSFFFSHETILATRPESRKGVKLDTLNVSIRKFISLAGPEDMRSLQ